MKVKWLGETSGITFVIAWGGLVSPHHGLTRMFGLDCRRDQQGRNTTYVLLYVDDVLVISEKAEAVLRKEISKDWILKEDSIGPPFKYLGGKLREVTLTSGVKCWAFGSSQYVQSAIKNVHDHLTKKGM